MGAPAFLRWDDGGTQYLKFDVVKSETGEFLSELTEHAVEKGANISDHKKDNPTTVALEVFSTNTPITSIDTGGVLAQIDLDIKQYRAPLLDIGGDGSINALPTPGRLINAGISAIKDAFAVPDTVNVLQFPESVRYKDLLDKLLDLKASTTLITIITATHEYPDMVLLRVSPHKTPEEGDGYSFSLEFKSIRIVTTAIVAAPTIAIPKAKPNVPKGAQGAHEGEGKAKVSAAAKATNAAGLTKAGTGRSSAATGFD